MVLALDRAPRWPLDAGISPTSTCLAMKPFWLWHGFSRHTWLERLSEGGGFAPPPPRPPLGYPPSRHPHSLRRAPRAPATPATIDALAVPPRGAGEWLVVVVGLDQGGTPPRAGTVLSLFSVFYGVSRNTAHRNQTFS